MIICKSFSSPFTETYSSKVKVLCLKSKCAVNETSSNLSQEETSRSGLRCRKASTGEEIK